MCITLNFQVYSSVTRVGGGWGWGTHTDIYCLGLEVLGCKLHTSALLNPNNCFHHLYLLRRASRSHQVTPICMSFCSFTSSSTLGIVIDYKFLLIGWGVKWCLLLNLHFPDYLWGRIYETILLSPLLVKCLFVSFTHVKFWLVCLKNYSFQDGNGHDRFLL